MNNFVPVKSSHFLQTGKPKRLVLIQSSHRSYIILQRKYNLDEIHNGKTQRGH
uniref:Uncharacterized protein n=1 Tax=Arundo donax TaxID=35708 RepID=A0A0A9ED16_ARUDO